MYGHDFVGLSHGGMWFLGFALVAAGSVGTLLALKLLKKPPQNTDRIDSLEILRTRLAKGDISIEEFNAIKATL
ncbi:MAG: hypothetical protein DELT_02856 [Desulfovibrio sp.]